MTKDLRINEEIRAKEVRVVKEDGTQLGIMPLKEALKIAEEMELDLVEIAPTAKPPVCKIMDYGKYRYQQSKKEKEARKKQKIINVKEIKIRPTIEEHDFQVKLKNVLRFLEDGDKVKVTVMFRGRELSHPEIAYELLNKMAQEVGSIAVVERPAKLEGRNMIMILAPKS
ncbi:translation initiation factor IF-3 [Carboxydothermus ferrireducens]|uniref:translation initiation factor IF-3 n=1 Tax=Carboxydothermus ferrireducens TaxID=54265 RepID=UPI000558046C|nr:translation initiation factor IF-3 [Carboxydothermus ferrireducens]